MRNRDDTRPAGWRLDNPFELVSREEAAAWLAPEEIEELDAGLLQEARRRHRPTGRPLGRPKLSPAEAEAAKARRKAGQAAWARAKRALRADRKASTF